ncbi:Cocaine esterase [Colletotrichum tanaceti]|uniref:Cocaine esterase n=1 Tax=Colletotrichum tanaceti TaxID=1306861 RepID=A0A4U6X1Q3_9PEZI|nr:Cocaine esterase [Colletotrichum tanaceti]TKW49270.1 Cocaine esterase [Colletotrichum tanaceti]
MTEQPAARRSFLAGLLDRAVGWALGLPAETSGYTTQPVKVPLPDGAALAADLYRPTDHDRPLGTVLVRTPYGRGIISSLLLVRIYAARGYQVLLVSARGTFGSTGVFDGGRCEAGDGQDVVAWMRSQPWYTGTFATLGSSFSGFTQWALLSDPPADLVAAVIGVAPHDYAERLWGTGAFALQQHLSWSDTMAHQETRGLWRQLAAVRDAGHLDPLTKSVPLEPALRRYFGDRAPWLFRNIGRPDLDDEGWAPLRHGKALERADVPILLTTGWHDVSFEQTVEQYHALDRRGCAVALRIGPGAHLDAYDPGDAARETLRWLDAHLARKSTADDDDDDDDEFPAVRVRRCGDAPEWLEMPKWPPPTSHRELFLAADGHLGPEQPSDAGVAGAGAVAFTFDPSDPTPTVGGPVMIGGGSVDDTALAQRADVVTFTTAPLTDALDIMGRPSVDLVHSSDNPFCDLFVRLSVVDARGRSRNVTEQYRRLNGNASRDPKLVALDLPDTAFRVPVGSRIRLVVAGGNFPKYGFNLGSGEDPATGTTLRPARHTVHFGRGSDSCLVLPVSS